MTLVRIDKNPMATPFNPNLSDFSEDHLQTILRLVVAEQMKLKQHKEALEEYPTLARMMRAKIHETELEIENLETLAVQFAGALSQKRMEVYPLNN